MDVRSWVLGLVGAGSGTSRMRAQSETVGMVLILGITIAGTGIMVSVGGDVLDQSKQSMEISNAEHAMTQLDSKASLVGHSSSSAQELTLGVGGRDSTVYSRDGGGWMRIRIDKEEDGTNEQLMNTSLGAVVYENGDTEIAYQGGGVWKQTGESSSMVSPPEFHYHKRTLTLPLVVVDNEATVGNSLRISQNGSGDEVYPNRAAGRRNPLPEGTVNITVKSEYYDAWGRYFEERTAGTVHYQPERERVTIQLTVDSSRPRVSQAIVSTSSQEMVIRGSGGSSFTDSYDSSVAPYSVSNSSNGTIVTSSDVEMSGGATIYGNLVSGGTVSMGGGANVTGNVSYVSFGKNTGNGNGGGGGNYHIGGWKAGNGSAPEVGAVDGLIDAKHTEIKQNNSNGVNAINADNSLNFNNNNTVKLKNGSYYLDEISVSNSQTLILDLSNGPIELAVAGDISVENGGTIKVTQPGQSTVKVYMKGDDVRISDGSVNVTDDKSTAFWLYGPAGTTGTVAGGTFTGVIYSPDSATKSGSMSVTSHGTVYGAVIGGQMTLQSGGAVHFDQALRDRDPIQSGQVDISRVTYLHVTVNHVNVTAS